LAFRPQYGDGERRADHGGERRWCVKKEVVAIVCEVGLAFLK
jgi:hypothetical protein